MKQFTYSSLKKPSSREQMLSLDVSSIGTQSGNYGVFYEQARVLTLNGTVNIELEIRKALGGIDYNSIIDECPTLKELLK